MEKVILKNQSGPGPFSPGPSPKEFFQADSSRVLDAKMCFPEGSVYDLTIYFVASFQDPELHHLIITTAKTQPPCFFFVTMRYTAASHFLAPALS